MQNEVLKDHYERKYAHESSGTSISTIEVTNCPSSRFEAALKFIPRFSNGGDYLEIGAGDGNIAKALLSVDDRISSYTLSDFSLKRLEGIRRNLDDPKVKILQIDAENMDQIEDNSYDVIILVALLEHLIDPLRAMQKIRNLLKPGGFVYLDTPNIAKYTRRIKLLLGRFPSTASANEGLTTYSGDQVDLYDEGHLHYFSFRSISLMLTQRCGFSKVVKAGYACGARPLGSRVHNTLALLWPELFSEITILAYA